ncbi:hypothetical protein [Planctobacterium marinum]|uniref:hypothetical protein n=1 Tax=Planctobacterium marinum TaxID=1631968 RepID=UPI001E55BA54|nr:hypothetical protein [Planctobacterium marinum]MCC2607716.1 hypothetical protein [Planctobacterium marinum]
MSRNKKGKITPEIEDEVCNLMKIEAARAEDGKVNLVKIAKLVNISRPTLYNNTVIKTLYNEINNKNHKPQEKVNEELESKLKKVKAETDRLKKTLKEYDVKFARWLFNATNAGLSIDELNRPVPESMKTTLRKKVNK